MFFFIDAPVCRADQKIVYGVSKLEEAHVVCKLDSFPQVSYLIITAQFFPNLMIFYLIYNIN